MPLDVRAIMGQAEGQTFIVIFDENNHDEVARVLKEWSARSTLKNASADLERMRERVLRVPADVPDA